MQSDDFLKAVTDPFTGTPTQWLIDVDLLEQLRQQADPSVDDLDVATALAAFCHDELQAYGTGGGEQGNDHTMTQIQRTLNSVLHRLGAELELPWRNFTTFRSYWIKKGCSNSYQARRDLLEEYFEPLHARLARMQDESLASNLAQPVSPRSETGWVRVDTEIRELRRRFRSASAPQDFRAIGTHCVGVMEALSATVYEPEKHLREGEVEPAVDKTNMRIERFVEDALVGPENASVRGLVKKAAELAHSVKHRTTPSRRDAGIASDSVILLSNLLRRIALD